MHVIRFSKLLAISFFAMVTIFCGFALSAEIINGMCPLKIGNEWVYSYSFSQSIPNPETRSGIRRIQLDTARDSASQLEISLVITDSLHYHISQSGTQIILVDKDSVSGLTYQRKNINEFAFSAPLSFRGFPLYIPDTIAEQWVNYILLGDTLAELHISGTDRFGDYSRTYIQEIGLALLSESEWYTNTASEGMKLIQFNSSPINVDAILSNTVKIIDNSTTWTPLLLNGQNVQINDINFVDANHGWIAGSGGFLWKTNDGGKTWGSCRFNGASALKAICFTSPETGFVGGDSDSLFKSTDSGNTWKSISFDTALYGCRNMFFIDPQHGVALSGANLLRTMDGGLHWSISKQSLSSGSRIPFAFRDSSTLFCLTISSQYASSTNVSNDVGSIWGGACALPSIILESSIDSSYSLDPLEYSFESLMVQPSFACYFFLNEKVGWILGPTGCVQTNDGGLTCKPISAADYNSWNNDSYFFIDSLDGWSVGASGAIFRTHDGGAVWKKQITNTLANLHSIVFVSDSIGWAVGDSGTLLKAVNHEVGVSASAPRRYMAYPKFKQTEGVIAHPRNNLNTLTSNSNKEFLIYDIQGRLLHRFYGNYQTLQRQIKFQRQFSGLGIIKENGKTVIKCFAY